MITSKTAMALTEPTLDKNNTALSKSLLCVSPPNMHDLVKAQQGKMFQWGVHDCLIFTGSIAQALSGKTIIEPIRGQYSSPKQALTLLKEYGLKEIDEIFSLFFEPIIPLTAQRGDVVLCEHEGLWNQAFAIVTGRVAVTTGETDLVKIPMNFWRKAWRVESSCLQ